MVCYILRRKGGSDEAEELIRVTYLFGTLAHLLLA